MSERYLNDMRVINTNKKRYRAAICQNDVHWYGSMKDRRSV